MVDQRFSNDDLSPRLRPVLSSLNVNLESELNRYRRNRLTQSASSDDVFADLEADAFEVNAVNIAATPMAASPPPVPPNKRLAAYGLERTGDRANPSKANDSFNADVFNPESSGSNVANSRSAAEGKLQGAEDRALTQSTDSLQTNSVMLGSIVNVTAVRTDDESADKNNGAPSSYLASSEKLIESLSDVPPMLEPVDINSKPRRKTVSLLVGAILGLSGLVAGLAVSYILATPSATQRFADFFKRGDRTTVATSQDTFDPPGPDLSEREFVDLKLDNLSSLPVASDPLNPSANPNGQPNGQVLPNQPPAPAQLPPIEGQIVPNPPISNEVQAAVLPAGVTYYVTVPFTSEQDLINVRQSVEEAFVRQFSDGNRIQIAAFDSPQDAQQFVSDMSAKGVTAFVYGPTTE